MKKIKKYLIPHEGNDYKPHLLRKNASLVLIGLALLIELALLSQLYVLQPGANFLAYIVPNVLVDLTNGNRGSGALPSLNTNFLLQAAANLKAQDMANKGYFAHVSPEGVSPWHWFQVVGYNYSAAGENLAVNFTDSAEVVTAWMNSEGHRKNILNQKFTEIGIGIASGMYKGQPTTFVAQLFGTPAKAVTSKVSPPKPVVAVTPPAVTPKPLAALEEVKSVETSSLPAKQINAVDLAGSMTSTDAAPAEVATVTEARESNIVMRLLATPRTFTAYIYLVLLGLVLLALILKVSVNSHIKHPALVLNGLIVTLMILSLMTVNKYMLASALQIF